MCICVSATWYHAISCSCAWTLIYWIVSQSTIVRLLVLDRTKCKPMLFEWAHFSNFSCYTEQNERERERPRAWGGERERGASAGVCADSTVHTLVIYVSIFNFIFSCSTERNVNPCIWMGAFLRLSFSTERNERERVRERERERGFEIGVCADSTVYVCIKATNGSNGKCSVLGIYRNFIYKGSVLGILYTCQMYDMLYL